MHKSHHIAMLTDMILDGTPFKDFMNYVLQNNIGKKTLRQAIEHAEFIKDLNL